MHGHVIDVLGEDDDLDIKPFIMDSMDINNILTRVLIKLYTSG